MIETCTIRNSKTAVNYFIRQAYFSKKNSWECIAKLPSQTVMCSIAQSTALQATSIFHTKQLFLDQKKSEFSWPRLVKFGTNENVTKVIRLVTLNCCISVAYSIPETYSIPEINTLFASWRCVQVPSTFLPACKKPCPQNHNCVLLNLWMWKSNNKGLWIAWNKCSMIPLIKKQRKIVYTCWPPCIYTCITRPKRYDKRQQTISH
jgi:hypothetical protein